MVTSFEEHDVSARGDMSRRASTSGATQATLRAPRMGAAVMTDRHVLNELMCAPGADSGTHFSNIARRKMRYRFRARDRVAAVRHAAHRRPRGSAARRRV
jgi:hypothetical protein